MGFYHGVGGDPAHPRPHPGPGAAGQTPGKSRQIAGEGVRMFLRVKLGAQTSFGPGMPGFWAGLGVSGAGLEFGLEVFASTTRTLCGEGTRRCRWGIRLGRTYSVGWGGG